MAHTARGRWGAWISLILRPEKLDELPETPKGSTGGSFFGWLMRAESLPFDEIVVNGQRGSSPSGLFAAESLPLDTPPDRRAGRRSFFAILFSRERLSDSPVAAPNSVSDARR